MTGIATSKTRVGSTCLKLKRPAGSGVIANGSTIRDFSLGRRVASRRGDEHEADERPARPCRSARRNRATRAALPMVPRASPAHDAGSVAAGEVSCPTWGRKAHVKVEERRRKGDSEGADFWLRIIVAIGTLGEPSAAARLA